MTAFTVSLASSGSEFELKCKYDRAFIDALKIEVPSFGRTWDNDHRTWHIDPDWYKEVENLVWYHFKFRPTWPQARLFKPNYRDIDFKLMYVGNSKGDPDRATKRASSGTDGKSWDYIFWEFALANWFTGVTPSRPRQQLANLYSILEIPEDFPTDQMKAAFWKQAKIWHPDVNKTPEATERFKLVNEAFETLSKPLRRARYDIGLKIEKEEMFQAGHNSRGNYSNISQYGSTFKPPVRCGILRARGYDRMGRFYITEVEDWNDIVDQRGRTLVTKWDMRSQTVVQEWYYS